MATTVNSDLIIYNDLAQTAYLERMQDVLQVFNEASRGAFVLTNESIEGDFKRRSLYEIAGGLEHRNVNSTAGVGQKNIGAGEAIGVKVPWKYGPYSTTEEAFKRRVRSLDEFSEVVGQHAADETLAYYIKAATAALEAAISTNPNLVVSGSFFNEGKKVLTKGLRKFGDRFGRVAIFAMDANTYFDLVDDSIDAKVFNEADVVIYGGQPGTLGKPVLVSDQLPPDAIFGLQAGAVSIIESQPPGFRSFEINDLENLAYGYRAEGVFNLEVLGYSWNADGAGGSAPAPANPNLTQIGTSANWVQYANSDKVTAGVLIEITGSAPNT
ncbi:hypothetical protein FHS82_001047 [Pseudochelatococcus lubricantis]|uniref:Major capsid protein n=1 Tax=Pseudochelatococcus lubricantis TaxID=1538102 RepID=A0ABX0UW84_9HYPH|nr:major capsid protein [Pseudochelatococcus lubricantis]NIJ57221.1 hypothetical protein [Pseudochelatococcus lubricantis]